MPNRILSLVAGGLLLVVPVSAQAANVTVRVEGKSATLVAPTTVTTASGAVVKDGNPAHSCTGTSAAGALEVATQGAWTGTWFDGLGYAIDSILGEAHSYSGTQSYWTTYLNGKYSNVGPCDAEMQTGDEVLFYPTCAGAAAGCYGGEPLDLAAPITVAPGQPFTVGVKETNTTYDQNFVGTSTIDPSSGATVSAGGSTATTDAQGAATLTLTTPGATAIRVTKGNRVPDQATVCVTDGSDGHCGTNVPVAAADTPPCVSNGHDGLCGSSDKTPAFGRILGISDGQRFAQGKGPRTLAGSVPDDPSGIKDVRIRLSRNDGGRCYAYDGTSEQFKRTRTCRAKNARFFSVGDRQQWSYLLPARLARGRYVLDVLTVDKAGNVDHLVRNRSRVVFRVA